MTYPLLAAAVTFATLAMTVLAASLLLAGLWPLLTRRLARYAPPIRTRALGAFRLLPALAGLVVSTGIVLPLFISFEPRDTRENIARTLIALAAAGCALIGWSVTEGVKTWQGTARLRRRWTQQGRLLGVRDTRLPVFAVNEAFPIVAVVGILRPALFIAERVLRECSSAELSAMIAHERAHAAARDNLWRFLMRALPALIPPAARAAMDRAWDEAAEQAADAAASARSATARFDLASALIHISRLIPDRGCAPAGVSAFHDGGPIESRVRRLLEPPVERTITIRRIAIPAATAVVLFAVTLTVFAPALHGALEVLVRLP